MSDTAPDKVICETYRRVCWRGTVKQVLRAQSPFDPEQEITACPNCKDDENLKAACDIEGCWNEATCGTPVPDARRYVRVCGEHYREITASAASPPPPEPEPLQ